MATLSCLSPVNLKTCMPREHIRQTFFFEPVISTSLLQSKTRTQSVSISASSKTPVVLTGILSVGLALAIEDPSYAAELQRQLTEPANALSLPTWAVHVSSVVEW